MKKIVMIFSLLLGFVHAQQVPKEVQKMIDGYTQETGSYGFKTFQKILAIDPSLQPSDIQAGTPLEVYWLNHKLLDTCGANLPVSELIIPANRWYVPVRANGKYLYQVQIAKVKGTWQWDGMDELKKDSWWQEMRRVYPENSGINPVIILDGTRKHLYFPQKGSYNMFFIKNGNEQDPLALNSSNSIDSLDDSRKFLHFRIKQWRDSKPKRDAFYREHPYLMPKDTGIGGVK